MTRPLHRLASALRAIAFWAAVALPLTYVPALVGLPSAELFLAIVPLHALCLFVGHEYSPGSRLGSPARP